MQPRHNKFSFLLLPVSPFTFTTGFRASDHWDSIEQQVPQVHQISKDERLCEFRSRHLDGILQFLRNVWQREPHVREEGDDGHEPGTGVEIRSWHHVVEVWCQETRTPVAPYHSVSLFVRMPNAKGHTQPITSRTADARRVINELNTQTLFH